jgi:predicted amidohydrolase YtcJ
VQVAVSILRLPNPRTELLRTWAIGIALLRGKKIAIVALARRMAAVLYAMESELDSGVPLHRRTDKAGSVPPVPFRSMPLRATRTRRGMRHPAAQEVDHASDATSVAAECVGVEKRTGAVARGLEAGFTVVDRDPLADITALQDVVLVVNKGKVIVNRLQD